jgi:hypothetical protein
MSEFDTYSNTIYFFGGLHDGDVYNDNLWAYNVSTNKWELKFANSTDKPAARLSSSTFIDIKNRRFFIFGGRSRMGLKNDMWMLDMNSVAWTEVIQKGQIPVPMSDFCDVQVN